MKNLTIVTTLATTLAFGLAACAPSETPDAKSSSGHGSNYALTVPAHLVKSDFAPASDPTNKAGWLLNTDISDEFNGDAIDHDKWRVQGHKGEYYIWKGRAPSQFAPHNVIVEDGFLKLRSQWEPDYKFADESYADGTNDDTYGKLDGVPVPVTTAAIISKKRFINGYMEVRSKAGHAAMTAAFWAIGHQQELDIFEQMGNPKEFGTITGAKTKLTVHDWSPPAVRPTRVFGYGHKLDYNVSDKFAVYAAEWGRDYLKFFLDGQELYHIEQKNIGTDWVLNNPMEIWLDSEIFKWLGLPHAEELPVDFEVDYVRVWQKPSENILNDQRQFFGFEGPYLFQDNPPPLKMLPEDVDNNDYQQFWRMEGDASAAKLKIVESRWHSGVKSLKYITHAEPEDLRAASPKGSISLPAGDYDLSFKIYLNHGIQPDFSMDLQSPNVSLPFSLKDVEREKWVTLTRRFTKTSASNPDDHMVIQVLAKDIPKATRDFYLDDIEIKAVK